jgi:hypothetical protein
MIGYELADQWHPLQKVLSVGRLIQHIREILPGLMKRLMVI